jgi:predicted nucleic acid-binding protein
VDRLFLDANILFSAAYRPEAGLRRLWALADVVLLSSVYALEEARVNLPELVQRTRLAELTQRLQLVVSASIRPLPTNIHLPPKDQPILLAAITARATHLLTGDVRDFGPYYGQTVEGVLIVPPAVYFQRRAEETRR